MVVIEELNLDKLLTENSEFCFSPYQKLILKCHFYQSHGNHLGLTAGSSALPSHGYVIVISSNISSLIQLRF